MNTSTLANHSLGRLDHRLTSLTRRLRRNPGDRRLLLEHALLTDARTELLTALAGEWAS